MSAQPAQDSHLKLNENKFNMDSLSSTIVWFSQTFLFSLDIFSVCFPLKPETKKKQFSIERFPIHVVPNGFRFTLCVYLGFCFVSFFFQLWASAWQSLSCLNELLVTNGIGFASSTTLQNFFFLCSYGTSFVPIPSVSLLLLQQKNVRVMEKGLAIVEPLLGHPSSIVVTSICCNSRTFFKSLGQG